MGNKPQIVIVDSDSESEDIFGSKISSSERFSPIQSVSDKSEIDIRRRSIRVPNIKIEMLSNKIASFSEDGQASWTLQKQREEYNEV